MPDQGQPVALQGGVVQGGRPRLPPDRQHPQAERHHRRPQREVRLLGDQQPRAHGRPQGIVLIQF